MWIYENTQSKTGKEARSSSCCLGVSLKRIVFRMFLFLPKGFIMWTERPNKTDYTISILLYMLFTGVSLRKLRILSYESLTKWLFLKYKLSFSWSIWNTVFSSSVHFRAASPSSVNNHVYSQIEQLECSQFLSVLTLRSFRNQQLGQGKIQRTPSSKCLTDIIIFSLLWQKGLSLV